MLIAQFQLSASPEQSNADASLTLMKGYEVLPAQPKVLDLNLQEGTLQLGFSDELFEPGNIAQLLSTLMPLDVGFPVLIASIHLPPGRKSHPRLGTKGFRELMNIARRPFLSAQLQPKTVRIEQCLEEAYQFFTHGIDIVRESAGLTSFPRAEFKERIEFMGKEAKNCSDRAKSRKCYVPNLTARTLFEMERRAEIARDHGIFAVTVNFPEIGWTALTTFAEICREQKLALMIDLQRMSFGHWQLSSTAESQLIAHFGVDACFISAESPDLTPVLRVLQSNDPAILPGLSRLKSLEEGSSFIRSFGPDLIVEGGHLLSEHPEGLKAGVKALREMLLA